MAGGREPPTRAAGQESWGAGAGSTSFSFIFNVRREDETLLG